ncbi:MAG TPA: hypothetical protein PLW44_03015 [Chitinophagales bacterium]|nr:hypothetical protein [Chitinophagales bacterium]
MKPREILNQKNIPIAFMLMGVIWCFLEVGLNSKFYVSTLCVLALVLCYVGYTKGYKYLLFIVLLATLFGWVSFFPIEGYVRFSVFKIAATIQVGGLILIGVTYWLNKESANTFIVGSFQHLFDITPERVQAMDKERYKNSVSGYKQRYQEYTSEQLTLILQENRYVPEALEAARQLLEERKNTGVKL